MKKVLMICLVLVGITTYAQHTKHSKVRGSKEIKEKMSELTPAQRADLKTKRMTLHLDLDKNQQEAVHKLLINEAEVKETLRKERKENKTATTKNYYADTSLKLDNAIKMKASLKVILTPQQYEKYERKMQHKRRTKRKRPTKKER